MAPTPPLPVPNAPGATIVAPGGTLLSPPISLQAPKHPPAESKGARLPAAPRARSGDGILQVAARFGAEASVINGGLHWRLYADRPDPSGVFRLIKEERAAQPTFVVPSGNYILHVSFGLVSAAKNVQARPETVREVFDLPAGGLTLRGQVGDVRIPTTQVAFDIYSGSQFEPDEREPVAANISSGQLLLLPEGIYYVVSKYGEGNSVVRSDIRVQVGRMTDVTVTHRAAAITFKLVSRPGGEALANTNWAVLSPAGDTIAESTGAFPRMILAEGEYKIIARNDERTFIRNLNVVTGVDSEVEVLAR